MDDVEFVSSRSAGKRKAADDANNRPSKRPQVKEESSSDSSSDNSSESDSCSESEDESNNELGTAMSEVRIITEPQMNSESQAGGRRTHSMSNNEKRRMRKKGIATVR